MRLKHRSTSSRTISVRRLAPAAGTTTREIERAVRIAAGPRSIASLSVAIVSDRHIAKLHEEFMDDPNPTDVLTFDLRDDESDAIEGEIVVSVDTARYEADRRGLDVRDELLRYVIHGVLHLNGLDDHTAAGRRQMRKAENDVLRTLAGKDARAGSVTDKHQGRAGRTRRNLSRKTR